MTQEHTITPPPELMHQWHKEACKDPYHGGTFFESKTLKHISTQAARWGSDQELEACCEWVRESDGYDAALALRADRRPKPPSLKELALDQLRCIQTDLTRCGMGISVDTIRRALESLPN